MCGCQACCHHGSRGFRVSDHVVSFTQSLGVGFVSVSGLHVRRTDAGEDASLQTCQITAEAPEEEAMETFSNLIASQKGESIDAHPGAKRRSNCLALWLSSTRLSSNHDVDAATLPDSARLLETFIKFSKVFQRPRRLVVWSRRLGLFILCALVLCSSPSQRVFYFRACVEWLAASREKAMSVKMHSRLLRKAMTCPSLGLYFLARPGRTTILITA